jgi:3-hydroxyisobutyrate dehydrogenase-like beta-hydroxyacid dehydrogenase
MSDPAIGFLGFGEAGFHIAKGLRSAGATNLFAFDIDTSDRVRKRADEAEVPLLSSNAALADASEIIFSVVTANQAANAARATAPHLSNRLLYADMNSVSPALKQCIADVIDSSGAKFVEIAIMAPVPPYAHKVPMLSGGLAARDFAERLSPFGMRIEVGDERIGAAAATKMCRSIVVKGLEAILTECVLAAVKYGTAERVFSSLTESFPGIDWNKLATYMTGRVVAHGERRAREMEEVAETLRSIGIDPIMAEAAARRMDWSAREDLKSKFGPNGPATYEEFAKRLLQ